MHHLSSFLSRRCKRWTNYHSLILLLFLYLIHKKKQCNFDWLDKSTCLANAPTPSPIQLAYDGTPVDPNCYIGRHWHAPHHVTTNTNNEEEEELARNICTNDKNYPTAWLHPSISPYYLFTTFEECCEYNYNNDNNNEEECVSIDVCIVGTQTPSVSPTVTPTIPPSHLYETTATTCNNRWHVVYTTTTNNNDNNNNVCTNDDNYPSSWMSEEKRQYFMFKTSEECCSTNFDNVGGCDSIVNVCPLGGPTGVPTTLTPTTDMPVQPTNRPTSKPTRLPTRRPLENPDAFWYINRASGK